MIKSPVKKTTTEGSLPSSILKEIQSRSTDSCAPTHSSSNIMSQSPSQPLSPLALPEADVQQLPFGSFFFRTPPSPPRTPSPLSLSPLALPESDVQQSPFGSFFFHTPPSPPPSPPRTQPIPIPIPRGRSPGSRHFSPPLSPASPISPNSLPHKIIETGRQSSPSSQSPPFQRAILTTLSPVSETP